MATDRCNPPGFEGSCRPAPASPQAEQQTTKVNVLITANQATTSTDIAERATTPGPRG